MILAIPDARACLLHKVVAIGLRTLILNFKFRVPGPTGVVQPVSFVKSYDWGTGKGFGA